MKRNDQLYLEMMKYYDDQSFEMDRYWNRSLYPFNKSTESLFAERRALDGLVSQFLSGGVLDLGCGSGHYMELYQENCSSALLIDQSSKMLAVSKSKVINKSGKNKITFKQSDFFDLDLPNNSFDSCLISFVLSHFSFELRTEIIKLVSKWLKPKGRLIVIDSLKHSQLSDEHLESKILQRHIGGTPYQIYKHYFESGEIQTMLCKQGYSVHSESFLGVYFNGVVASKNKQVSS